MDEPASPTPSAVIGARAQALKLITLGFQLALPVLLHPQAPMADMLASFSGVTEDGRPPVDLPLHLTSDDRAWTIEFSIREVFAKLSSSDGAPVANDMMTFGMMMSVATLDDMIKAAHLRDFTNPTLEFLRHLRNAAAHGDRWHFTSKEPKHAAHFDNITLTSARHGQRAFWETVSPFTFVRLIDAVTEIFAPELGVTLTRVELSNDPGTNVVDEDPGQ